MNPLRVFCVTRTRFSQLGSDASGHTVRSKLRHSLVHSYSQTTEEAKSSILEPATSNTTEHGLNTFRVSSVLLVDMRDRKTTLDAFQLFREDVDIFTVCVWTIGLRFYWNDARSRPGVRRDIASRSCRGLVWICVSSELTGSE